MHSSHPSKVSTLRGQLLGQQLRALREEIGLSLEEAASYLNRDRSALGRFERAEWPFPRPDVRLLLDFYGVVDKEVRDHFIRLSEEVGRRHEWETEFEDAIYDKSFVDLPWLEEHAEAIRTFDATYVPGLLQTPGYAGAILREVERDQPSAERIDRWVAMRLARQGVLTGVKPTRLTCILTEAVLRARIGGDQVMRGQLDHLVQLGRQRHIELRVLPLALGGGAGAYGPFQLFELVKPFPPVAYVEHLGGRLFLEWPRSTRFVQAYDRLRETALTPSESTELMTAIAEEI
ncbi:helix-turn-helix transcriptional regulator [Plantactinospora sp. B6F1]|uniref:Scr1 family TA system antitoxin-like transcriptional regulator n=1 Tax=Plantactinospora sp. B6F1 TaxID=3158971 RepID=UPI00102BE738